MTKDFKPIEFPQDEQAHDNIIEWWYFNGHLKDGAGNRYAFMNCLFRADVKKVKIPFLSKIPVKIIYFYHTLISDLKNNKFYPTIDYVTIVSNDSFTKPRLFVNHVKPMVVRGYVNRVLEETAEFVYHLKDENMDLKMTSTKPPLLEGGTGYVDLHSKTSYYYSLTNLKTEGKIKVNGVWIDVSGKSWMDHQWADVSYSKDQWTWFSVQLNDGRELVCYEYDDKKVKSRLVSISDSSGQTKHFKNVEFTPLADKWQSPKTKTTYPLAWKIKVPEENIELEIRPVIKEQEVVFGSISYWEGPMSASGQYNGKKISGDGFMELVGYPTKYGSIKYAHDKLIESARDMFIYTKKKFLELG